MKTVCVYIVWLNTSPDVSQWAHLLSQACRVFFIFCLEFLCLLSILCLLVLAARAFGVCCCDLSPTLQHWPFPGLTQNASTCFSFFVFSFFDLNPCTAPSSKHCGKPPVYVSLNAFSLCLSLSIFVSIFISFCVSPSRLSLQTVSHEPLLGPEAVLESSEAWREHGHGAAQQAPCKRSVDMFVPLQSLQTSALHTDLSSQAHRMKRRKDRAEKDFTSFNLEVWMIDLVETECKAT